MSIEGNVLIVQNKGGGHSAIGYHLSQSIKTKYPQSNVYILQDSCNYKKIPFSFYENDLKPQGVKIVDSTISGDLATSLVPDSISNVKFDYIIDNWSKTVQNATFVSDIAKKSSSKQYVFISSGIIVLFLRFIYLTECSWDVSIIVDSTVERRRFRKIKECST